MWWAVPTLLKNTMSSILSDRFTHIFSRVVPLQATIPSNMFDDRFTHIFSVEPLLGLLTWAVRNPDGITHPTSYSLSPPKQYSLLMPLHWELIGYLDRGRSVRQFPFWLIPASLSRVPNRSCY